MIELTGTIIGRNSNHRTVATMSKTVADLKLDDEHITIGIDDTMAEAARRLLTLSGGILIVLDEDSKTKGVIGNRQFLKALAENVNANDVKCSEWMEMDFLEVKLSETLKSVLSEIKKRAPQAVVAVEEDGEFVGYFSPSDYQQATSLVSSLKGLEL
tara:strand:- start:1695 stop:2165 length:471 start_codon:yes stop_codon:yes gene_type:complete